MNFTFVHIFLIALNLIFMVCELSNLINYIEFYELVKFIQENDIQVSYYSLDFLKTV